MKNKILFILSLLFGLMFINGGLNKFFNYIPVPEDIPEASLKDFQAMMEIAWLMPLLAVAEIVGGLLIILPRTRAIGALVIFPVMVGILLTHIVVDKNGLLVAIVLAAVLAWIIYDNRHKYLPLLKGAQ